MSAYFINTVFLSTIGGTHHESLTICCVTVVKCLSSLDYCFDRLEFCTAMIPHPINFKLSGGCSWLKYLIIAKVFNGLSLCPCRLGKCCCACFPDENMCPGFVLHCFNEVCFLLLLHPFNLRQRRVISRSRREHPFLQTELGMDLGLDAFLGVP